MSRKPGTLAAAGNVALFATICVVAYHRHYWQQLKQALFGRRQKKTAQDDKKKKLIVITGCDRGFGRLLATELRNTTDYLVLALTLTKEAATEMQAEASSQSKSFAIQCDVTSEKDVMVEMKKYAESILDREKAVLHTIVNNAGIADPGDFAWFSDVSTFQRVMDVNYFGQLRVTQALLPLMLRTSQSHGGRILNLSSVCGTSASPSNSAYNASKFAVEAWSDSLRLELQPFNISVVKVRPGQVSTHIQADWVKKFIKNYESAPRQIRELYGGDDYKDMAVATFQASAENGSALSQPSIVVDGLMDMISTKQHKLEANYWIGQDAHTLWRALHTLPTTVADSIKRRMFYIAPLQQSLPPIDIVSHVTIRVKSIEQSLSFYNAFGLEPVGDSVHGQKFLRSGSSKAHWATMVLLREDSSMAARGKSYEAGMTRLCIYSTNINAEVQRLSKLGLEPIGLVADDGMAKIAAYYDPDKFVVYLIQAKGVVNSLLRANMWWNKKRDPYILHWTVNVTNAKVALSVFEALGFKKFTDQTSDQVRHGLLPAFNMDPETTIIEHIRLCRKPGDAAFATIMEWINPKSERKGAEALNSMTISVADVDTALERARGAGMMTEPAEYRTLPVFGQVLVGTAYVEPVCNPIEFCCFTNKK